MAMEGGLEGEVNLGIAILHCCNNATISLRWLVKHAASRVLMLKVNYEC